jgi:calpain-15
MKGVGLVDAHAYSLIAAKEIKNDLGKPIRLLQIRNPWGKKEWTGDWSD